MTKEEIKNMSDEDFIKLINGLDKINKEEKDGFIYKFHNIGYFDCLASVVMGLSTGVISTSVLHETGVDKVIAALVGVGINIAFTSSFLVLAYKENKRNKIEHFKLYNDLKKTLENLSKEEYDLLIKSIKLLEENKFDNKIIENSDVLLASNKLIELNATGLLDEYEAAQTLKCSNSNYIDGQMNMGYSKKHGKNN